ncbi:uncharacterized protein [Montipora foliosa]|uniref:uncharacterized protein n=1 Tax=Montipora foliosa TaxID=591990 RepID=UPI0035F1ACA9
MLLDADVSPTQEINYLRSFTSGRPQRLVDNYRKRQMRDPVALLKELWDELERRFGSVAVISNTLLERLRDAATFGEREHDNLQLFADLCADIESQVTYLPGLQCLNYPNAMQPITEKLPRFIRAKWEKEIACYSNSNGGAYPPFSRFSKIVQEQSKIKNDPNVLAGQAASPTQVSTPKPRKEKKTLKTETRPAAGKDGAGEDRREALEKRENKTKHCPYHERDGHDLQECKAFTAKPLEERGVSFSKTLLVDVYSRRNPHLAKRVYAIVDEQSNSSLVTSELADDLGADGPLEKYFLSTCSGEKEEKYGRRVAGITVRSLSGAEFAAPTLTECDTIPQDKSEIPTPDMARSFPHLKAIAHEIPPINETAKIHLLLGRDAPELLKVREFRNGPKGAPWAQRLALGWTISGQMCLDFASGPAHVLTRLTSLSTVTEKEPNTGSRIYELVPCPNQIKVTDPLLERATDDIFRKTRDDNEPGLSREDRKFLEILDRGIHKNAKGNWEMPLPFRNERQTMPNNRYQAMQRLQGLLKTFARKPEMKADYQEFMGRIIDKGHASAIPSKEVPSPPGRSWYLPHFATYHNTKRTIRVVFDSSCEFGGISLNKVLLSGPDLMNNLIGVLMRFRKVQRSKRSNYSSRLRPSKSRPVNSDEYTASRTVRSGLSCSSSPESYKRNRSEDF